jgi:hypothetical protein
VTGTDKVQRSGGPLIVSFRIVSFMSTWSFMTDTDNSWVI